MGSSNTKDSTAKSLANTLSNVSKLAKSYGINTSKADAMVAQTKAEGSKSFKGSSYEKDYQAGKYGVITSEKIQPTTPITLPPPPQPDGMFGVLESNTAAVTTPTETQPTSQEGYFQNLVQQYLGANAQAYSEVPSSVDRLKESRKLYAPQEKLVSSLQNQLGAITSSRDQEMLKLEGQGRGQTEGFIGGEQARISREAAIRAMPVQAQLAAAQQDLDSARSYAAQYFQAVTQDDIARYNYQKDVNSTIFSYLNASGQRALEAKQKEEDRAFQVLQSNRQDLKQLSLQAIEYGQPTLAGEFMRLDPTSTTYDSDVADAMSRLSKPTADNWKLTDVNGKSAWVNEKTQEINYVDGAGGMSYYSDSGEKVITMSDGSFKTASTIDFNDPQQIDSLPVNDITKAIISGIGKTKDLTPTDKKTVLEDLQKIGFNPNTYVVNKLNLLLKDYVALPESSRGLAEGSLKFWQRWTNPDVAEFESNKTILTREIARLNDVGVLSDQDVKSYTDAMPSRMDADVQIAMKKASGIASSVTGKSPESIGEYVQLSNGKVAIVGLDGDTLLDPVTLEPIDETPQQSLPVMQSRYVP